MASNYRIIGGRLPAIIACLAMASCGAPAPAGSGSAGGAPALVGGVGSGGASAVVTEDQVLRGRALVINHACGDCHGGMPNPAADGWLAGQDGEGELIGPFRVWPRNLTPDEETGLGRISERQIFNALRYGLRPSATPDVEITSAVPGTGNHPENPNYLAPGMPWLSWRYMSDQELWDIAAYLKHGLQPVTKSVPESEAPPDFWASEFTVEKVGTHLLPPYPTQYEVAVSAELREPVLRGRELVAGLACADCHGGALHPGQEGWLWGSRPDAAPIQEFEIGPFTTRPRNLTPDNATGMGRFSERQIFNALRYGLRPGETEDVEITSTVPGEGNHPINAKYLAPPMPWPAWRHLSDREIRDIAAYLKHGVAPVEHRVADSEGPPDFWASEYTVDKIGPYPARPFPTANERRIR